MKLVSYVVSTAYGLKPGANVKVEINGKPTVCTVMR